MAREATATVRVSAAELAEWRGKVRAAGVSLSELLRRAMARTRTWTEAAAEYLLEERNAAGEEREEVEVLRGDPWRVAEVADSLEFEYRYTSRVIA